MKKLIIILSFAFVLSAGCTKETTYDKPLTLSAERNELSSSEGSTPVIIYANEAWTATLSADCDWARIDKTEGDGLGEVVLSYDSNPGGARKATITVTSGSTVKTIEIIQKASADFELAFKSDVWDVAKCSGVAHLPFVAPISESEIGNIKVSVSPENCGWIGDISVFKDELMFNIESNTSGVSRKVDISIAYTDIFGEDMSAQATISQTMESPKVKFDKSPDLSWEETVLPVNFQTNMGLFIPQLLQSLTSSVEWCEVSYADRLDAEFSLSIDENSKPSSRQGRITMSYTDNEGNASNFYYIILQKKQ